MLKPIDAVAHVRRNPQMYCMGAGPDAKYFATRMASDALTLGATRTINVHRGDYWAVAADIDWLATSQLPIRELFESVVAFPERAVNDFRSEVLLTAFAEFVATYTDGAPAEVLKGQSGDITDVIASLGQAWKRVVVFRMQPARVDQPPAGVLTVSN